MGDVGALALGASLGTIAVIVRQEIVLAIMGGIFVVEALSVMLQVTWFKFTKKRYGQGRRLLKMAPLHHHFEKSRSEEHTSELQSPCNLVCRLLLEKKKNKVIILDMATPHLRSCQVLDRQNL